MASGFTLPWRLNALEPAWPGRALPARGWAVGKVRALARLSSRESHSSTADSRRADPRGAEDRRVWQWEERTLGQHCLDLVIYVPQAPSLPVHMAQHSCECLVCVSGSDICPGLLIFLCAHAVSASEVTSLLPSTGTGLSAPPSRASPGTHSGSHKVERS